MITRSFTKITELNAAKRMVLIGGLTFWYDLGEAMGAFKNSSPLKEANKVIDSLTYDEEDTECFDMGWYLHFCIVDKIVNNIKL